VSPSPVLITHPHTFRLLTMPRSVVYQPPDRGFLRDARYREQDQPSATVIKDFARRPTLPSDSQPSLISALRPTSGIIKWIGESLSMGSSAESRSRSTSSVRQWDAQSQLGRKAYLSCQHLCIHQMHFCLFQDSEDVTRSLSSFFCILPYLTVQLSSLRSDSIERAQKRSIVALPWALTALTLPSIENRSPS
jgi:hypothetical protein